MKTMIAAICAVIFALVLAAPIIAAAECAWVLWEENPLHSNNWRLQLQMPNFTVFENQKICTNAANTLLDSLQRFNSDARRENRQEQFIPNFVCLPDTMDPRGPKGGGR